VVLACPGRVGDIARPGIAAWTSARTAASHFMKEMNRCRIIGMIEKFRMGK
jgi:hypothetical protein